MSPMSEKEWRDVPLSDLATIVGGGTPSRAVADYWGPGGTGELPWATPTDVTGLGGRFIKTTKSTLTEAGLASSSAVLLPPYSLLVTTRATIGVCAINRVPMATNQGFQNLVPKPDVVDIDFLYYLVSYHSRRLRRLAAGSTFLEVSKSTLASCRVSVPSLAKQRDIAAILTSVDDAVEKSQVVIDEVQTVKQGVMRHLFDPRLAG